jgi:hypothetical protein
MKLNSKRDGWLLEAKNDNSLSFSCCSKILNFVGMRASILKLFFLREKLHLLLFKTLQLVELLCECGSS